MNARSYIKYAKAIRLLSCRDLEPSTLVHMEHMADLIVSADGRVIKDRYHAPFTAEALARGMRPLLWSHDAHVAHHEASPQHVQAAREETIRKAQETIDNLDRAHGFNAPRPVDDHEYAFGQNKGGHNTGPSQVTERPSPPDPMRLPEPETSQAERDVLAERRRQVVVEGWDAKHDDAHDYGDLAAAGAGYAVNAADQLNPYSQGDGNNEVPHFWPFEEGWWKPKTPREDLVRAAALIIAEIDRLDRVGNP